MTPQEIERAMHRKSRNKRYAEMQADPNDRSHGTWSGYKYGCRCERCTEAMHEYCTSYYAKNKDRINAKTRERRRKAYEADPEKVRAYWRLCYRINKARKSGC